MMYVQSLSLRHFRTYARLELELPPAPILLLGENAQGKTSLLEAIAYLALGRSPLTNTERHLIHWGAVEEAMPFATVAAEVQKGDRKERLEIAIQHTTLANGNVRLLKKIRIDGRSVRRADLAGHLNVVLFLPEDIALVSGPPAGRRRHLDDLLSQVSADYVRAAGRYQSALSRRNALLRHLRDEGGDPAQLIPLERELATNGLHIALRRRQLLHRLTRLADRYHQRITDGAWLRLLYQPNFAPLRPPEPTTPPSYLDEAEEERIEAVLLQTYLHEFERRRSDEITRGMTLVGPHRDEVRFIVESVDLGTFGSRGQQRSAVLALRLAELEWLREISGEAPVLLLDEVLAELDIARRHRLLDLLGEVEQTILATTDAEMFPSSFRRQAMRLRVRGGIITPA